LRNSYKHYSVNLKEHIASDTFAYLKGIINLLHFAGYFLKSW